MLYFHHQYRHFFQNSTKSTRHYLKAIRFFLMYRYGGVFTLASTCIRSEYIQHTYIFIQRSFVICPLIHQLSCPLTISTVIITIYILLTGDGVKAAVLNFKYSSGTWGNHVQTYIRANKLLYKHLCSAIKFTP